MSLWPPRWLALLAPIALILLLGLATSTEPAPEPEADDQAGRDRSSSETDSDRNSGSFDSSPAGQSTDDLGGGGSSGGSGRDRSGFELSESDGTLVSFDVQGNDVDGEEVSVGIRVDDDSITAFPRLTGESTGEATGNRVGLEPDEIDEQVGYRVGSDAGLDPITGDQVEPDDLVIQPAPDGVDLVGADGSRIEIRQERAGSGGAGDPDGPAPNGGVTVTEVAPDGTPTPRTPDSSGRVAVDDDTTIQLPVDGSELGFWSVRSETPWRAIVIGYAILAILGLATALYLHLTRPEPFGPDFVAEDGVPPNRFADFLAMLQDDPDPTRAIRLAFAAAERGFGTLPTRTSTETPFEWSGRVAADKPELAEPLTSLCSRFALARFAPDRATAADRDAAVSELQHLAHLSGYVPDPARTPIHDPVPVGTTGPAS